MKPSKQNIKKWCEALRSGEYRQGQFNLQTGKSFCCLGVAVKEFVPKGKRLQHPNGRLLGGTPIYQMYAPEWLKVVNSDFYDRTGENLTNLNDRDKLTFDEIADCLEAVYIHEVLE